MATDLIRYDLLVQDALRGVVRTVLSDAARDGLPGDHHFYVTFRTHARGVRLSTRMREQYPEEMTIVLQHQFWDLSVTEHAFEVGLSFKNVAEMLLIPFDAVTRFTDPSVEFDLRFEPEEPANDLGAPQVQPTPSLLSEAGPRSAAGLEGTRRGQHEIPAEASHEQGEDREPSQAEAKVVSIDAFRKKP